MSLMLPKEVAAEMRVSEDTVARWIAADQLPAINVGTGARRRYRIDRRDLEHFKVTRAVAAPKVAPKKQRNSGRRVIEFY